MNFHGGTVALLAEGVDRNSYEVDTKTGPLTSPSSRRAWIEIGAAVVRGCPDGVALLAEGVDRNSYYQPPIMSLRVALLAEGVDRNTQTAPPLAPQLEVALLAEGVDRNFTASSSSSSMICRPPRGGRG